MLLNMYDKPFPVDETCHIVAENEDIIVYFVETSRCAWVVDKDTMFKVNDSSPVFKDIGQAKQWAQEQI